MSKLNYGSFEKAVFPYCSDISRIEDYIKRKVGLLDVMSMEFFDAYILLAAGLTDQEVERLIEGRGGKSGGLSEAMLSRYRNDDGSKFNRGIAKAYTQKGSIGRTKEHFRKYLLKTIIRDGEYRILYDVWQLILHDETIPRVYRDDFEFYYGIDSLADFLANVFVFAVTRPFNENINVIGEHEKSHPRIHPDTARVIRDVQIRSDTDALVEKIKEISRLLDSETLDDKIRASLQYDAAMLWRETRSFVDVERMSDEERVEYELLGNISYSMEFDEAYVQSQNDFFDRVYKLDEKYDSSED